MSWEANRWTARTPSELYHTLGPHAVDDLIRQMISAVWRHLPEEGRTFQSAIASAREVFDRNIAVWKKIKQPDPASFFADLRPIEADGHLRQAMVLTWMMMPRTGGRDVKEAIRIVTDIMERNLRAWEEDQQTFTGGKKAKKKSQSKPKPPAVRVKGAKPMNTRPAAPSRGSVRSARVAKESEVAPLRKQMDQKMKKAGAGKTGVGKK